MRKRQERKKPEANSTRNQILSSVLPGLTDPENAINKNIKGISACRQRRRNALNVNRKSVSRSFWYNAVGKNVLPWKTRRPAVQFDESKIVKIQSAFLIGYGVVRFFIEYFRQPDVHLGFVWLSFSMGQILCALMIFSGIFLAIYLRYRKTA